LIAESKAAPQTARENGKTIKPIAPNPNPYSLFPVPYSLFPIPCFIHTA